MENSQQLFLGAARHTFYTLTLLHSKASYFFSSFKRLINSVIIEYRCFIVDLGLNVASFGSSIQTLARDRPVGFQSGAVEPAERSDVHVLSKTPRRTVT